MPLAWLALLLACSADDDMQNAGLDAAPPSNVVGTEASTPATHDAGANMDASLAVADSSVREQPTEGGSGPVANDASSTTRDAADAEPRDSSSPEDDASLPPQVLPQALRDMGIMALTPAPGQHEMCTDPALRLRFEAAPTLGSQGKVSVFDSAAPGTPVASVDMARASITETRGGVSFNMQRPAYVDGNEAVFYLPTHALKPGRSYFVQLEAGVLKSASGKTPSISDNSSWVFHTGAGNAKTPGVVRVAQDGSGDFCSVQGAVDALGAGPTTIRIARGRYHGIVYFKGKRDLTLRGDDRKGSVLLGTNNESMNPGTAKRALIGVDDANNVRFENLTIHNLTPQGGTQAEALRMQGCERCSVRDADLLSLQDTLLWSGHLYAKNSLIAGNVDFVWGTGAAYFDQCEIRTVGRTGYIVQARNGADGYGYVFVDSKLTSDANIRGNYLARIEGQRFPASHVAFIDCEMGAHIDPAGFQVTGGGGDGLRFWEYRSRAPGGALLDVSRRLARTRQLSADEAARMRDPSTVLGGWMPE